MPVAGVPSQSSALIQSTGSRVSNFYVESAMSDRFRPIAYVKEGCPYSEKLLTFLSEAQLTDSVDIVRCAIGTPTMEAVREKLSTATGDAPKFPTVEVQPGEFRTESAELIEYFSRRYGKNAH